MMNQLKLYAKVSVLMAILE